MVKEVVKGKVVESNDLVKDAVYHIVKNKKVKTKKNGEGNVRPVKRS